MNYEHSEVAEDAKRVGEEFLSRLGTCKDNVVELWPQRAVSSAVTTR